ncbi:hypothetical protein TWF281_009041 [Arthrobotrys megalospora]
MSELPHQFYRRRRGAAGSGSSADDLNASENPGTATFNNTEGSVGIQAGFVQGNITINQNQNYDSIIKQLPTAPQAVFNSAERSHDPTCLPDTRVDILKGIRRWADTKDERCIFWLNGLAGTGKSTISRTIAREYYKKKRLGASFFFSRGGGDISHAGKFFTSIAVQLAGVSPSLKRHICEAIVENGNIGAQSLRDQWDQLILQPLSKSGSYPHQSLVIVVDALDECDDENDIRTILQLLTEAASLDTVKVRIFMTSRPEVSIRHGFRQISDSEHHNFVLHNVSPSIIDHDISIFLEYHFELIRKHYGLHDGWPGDQQIKALLQRASGLFIWAATAFRFVKEGKGFAPCRLSLILEGNASFGGPEKHLNDIYLTVLENSISPDYTPQEQEILFRAQRETIGTIVVLFSPLSAVSLATLLQIPKPDIVMALDDLHSILHIPEDQTQPIRLHHLSFRDFLLDENRCSNPLFQVDEKEAHKFLALSCLQLMSEKLERDICKLRSPGTLAADVQWDLVMRYLPNELQYACLYWVQHVQKSETQLRDDGQVLQFLQRHFLHWLEALSLMRKTSEGILAILSLSSTITGQSPRLEAFIYDVKRFTLYNRPVIEEAPLQLYHSALIFAPKESVVRGYITNETSSLIRRFPEVPSNWHTLQQTLEGHSGAVSALAFSSDGKRVASGSRDCTVKIWDTATGALQQTLKGHDDRISEVLFSPNGNVVAFGAETAKLWEVTTGALQRTLEGDGTFIGLATLSPDGKLLASGLFGGEIELWDTTNGTLRHTLQNSGSAFSYMSTRHAGVCALVFSPDGERLTAASTKYSGKEVAVTTWDAATGARIRTLDIQYPLDFAIQQNHSSENRAVLSPNCELVVCNLCSQAIGIWSLATGALLQILVGHPRGVSAMAFSPDSKRIASGSFDQTIKIWDAVTGSLLRTLRGHSDEVKAVAFSPNGNLVASGSVDGAVKLWDVSERTLEQVPEDHWNRVVSLAASPNGKSVASGFDDGLVKLWDTATGALQRTLNHLNWVSAVAFSQDGKQVASSSDDGSLRIWNASTGALQWEWKICSSGSPYECTAIAFSPDDSLAAFGTKNIIILDLATGVCYKDLRQLDELSSGAVTTLAFSADGKQLASGTTQCNGFLNIWDVATGDLVYGHTFLWDSSSDIDDESDSDHKSYSDHESNPEHKNDSNHKNNYEYKSHSDYKSYSDHNRNSDYETYYDHESNYDLNTFDSGFGFYESGDITAVAFSPRGKLLARCSDRAIQLLDPITNRWRQITEVDAAITRLSFSKYGPYLETERGLVQIAGTSSHILHPRLACNIFVTERWVVRDMEKILWLPPDYRVVYLITSSRTLVLGHPSGLVTFIEFN